MKSRGLYGQDEGNGQRSTVEGMEERCLENDLVEGEWERPMIVAAKRGELKELERLREGMKAQAVRAGCRPDLAQERADSTLRRALRHLRL